MKRICPKCKALTDEALCPADGYQTVVYKAKKTDDHDPLLGKVFEERYTLDAVIGRGGFGAVYRATQLAIGRTVAIKVLKAHLADDLKEVARFQQEARAIAALKHPNIVEIYDFGQTAEGSLYLVMDFLDGKTLDSVLKAEGRLEVPRATSIAVQALDALAEAHSQQIVHRDLKPENLFIAKEGRRQDVVKLLDFGIAKVSGDVAAEITLTQAGMAIGSPKFMSPEQCRGKKVTAQSDLYSFGCILYRMLFGRQVFEEDAPSGYLIAHTTQQPEIPTIDGAQPAGPVVDLVFKCLEKSPQDRPESAEALARDLKDAAPAGITWEPVDEPVLADDDSEMTRMLAAGSAAPPISDSATVALAANPNDATVALSTGLSSPSDDAQADEEAPAKKRGWGLWAAALLLLGGGAAAAILAMNTDNAAGEVVAEAPAPAPTEPTEAAPAPTTPKPEAAPAPTTPKPEPAAAAKTDDRHAPGDHQHDTAPELAEDTKPAPTPAAVAQPAVVKRFEVEVASKPGKAQVWRAGELLGKTPLKVGWAKGEDAPVLELRRTGYRRAKVVLAEADDGQTHLQKMRKAPTKPKASRSGKGQEPKKW